MKKFFLPVLLAVLTGTLFNPLFAQKYVSTQASKKNAVIELFTAVRDPYSYAGNEKAKKMTYADPARIFMIAYHPSNASYTLPFGDDEDLSRNWPNNFFTTQFAGMNGTDDLPFAFINRRLYNSKRALKRTEWAYNVPLILNESSPCNVGFNGTYDPNTKSLTVDVEVYFTAAVTDKYHIYAVLLEDSIVTRQAWQYGFGDLELYPQKKVFRDSITPGAWGDPINEATNQGSLITRKYTFNNSTRQYNIEKCSVVVFIRNATNEEIVTGWGSKAHTDRLVLSPALPAFAAAGVNEAKEQIFTLKNNSDTKGNLQVSFNKSSRTPSDWTLQYSIAKTGIKKAFSPQSETVSVDPHDSIDITVTIKPGATTGVGDAFLDIFCDNIYNEKESGRFTAITNTVENLEVMERPEEGEPYSLNPVIEATGRGKYLKFDARGMASVYSGLTKLKTVSWSFNPCDSMIQEYGSTIVNMMKNGVRFLIAGSFPITTLYEENTSNPFFKYTGVMIDISNKHYFGGSFTFTSDSADPYFPGLSLPWVRNEETDSLTQPLAIRDSTIASKILTKDKLIMATKSRTAESKAVVIHFNPYSLSSSSDRNGFIDKCLDWLERDDVQGPVATLNTVNMKFGEVKGGSYKDTTLEIANTGNSDLTLVKTEITGTNPTYFTVTDGIGSQVVLAPGAKDTITIRFSVPSTLTAARDYTASIEIATTDSEHPLRVCDLAGRGIPSNGVEDEADRALLVKATPNPFSKESVISFELNHVAPVNVEAMLIDVSGRKLETVYDGLLQPGNTVVRFNATATAPGTYFLVVKSVLGNYNIPVVIVR